MYLELLCAHDNQIRFVPEALPDVPMLINAGNLQKASVAKVAPDVVPQGSPRSPQGPAKKHSLAQF